MLHQEGGDTGQREIQRTGEAGEAKVSEVEKEMHGGKTIYSAEFDRDGKEHEVYVAEDGKLLSREVEVSMDDLPAAVKETIQRETNGADVEELARVTKDGKTLYEAEWEADGKEREVLVSDDGKIVPHEREHQPAK